MDHAADRKQKIGHPIKGLGLGIFLLFLCGAGFLLVLRKGKTAAPIWLKQKIISSVTNSCPLCKIEIGTLDISLTQGRFGFDRVKFSDEPNHGHDSVDLTAERIEVQISNSITALLVKKISIDNPILISKVLIRRMKFKVIEDPSIKSKPDEGTTPLIELPPMVVSRIKIEDSEFRYIDLVKPQPASLSCTEINGEIGGFSSRKELSKARSVEMTAMHGTGIFDNTGHFNLKIDADVLSQKGTVEIDVEVKDQPLEAAAQFFSREEMIKLHGRIADVRAQLSMRDGRIQGNMTASYKDLGVKTTDPKTNGIKKALENIGSKIAISREKGVDGKPVGSAQVQGVREPEQGIVAALFHALGMAAKKLVRR